MELIKDLGMMFRTSNSKRKERFGSFFCRECSKGVKVLMITGHTNKTCNDCKNIARKTHGMSKTRPHGIWQGMITRTTNPNAEKYPFYKDKRPHEKWLKFEGFWDDMEDGYADGLSLDRIDNSKPYSKENCRWVTMSVQAINQRRLSAANTSGFKGVTKHREGKWQVAIRWDKKLYYLGLFKYPWTAAYVYDSFVINNNTEHTRNFEREVV